jgi:pimeloyl-ACP methyl ester carboxylesterase
VPIQPEPADHHQLVDRLPKETRIAAGALALGALEYGDVTAAPVLVLHGHADQAWSMDSVARPLADRYRVVSLDLRGHGRSDWGPYTLPHLVGDIRGVIEALELEAPLLIGHSLGGQAAAQFCGLYPEIPRAVVLIEALGPPLHRRATTDPDGFEREHTRMRVELVRQPARSRRYSSFEAALARFRAAHPLLDAERAALLVDKGTRELPDGSREWRFDPATRDWIAGHEHWLAEQRWRGITCPVQVVLGTDSWDRFWKDAIPASDEIDGPMPPAELDRRLSNFADVRCAEIEGAGHMVHYDRPSELNDVIDRFLATCG